MTIASEITRLQGAKADIRQAIIDKGVDVPASDNIDCYACCINDIPTGGGGKLVDVMVVAGGGAGGKSRCLKCAGGGGGAGGYIEECKHFVSEDSYCIVVGEGHTGYTSRPERGGDSCFGSDIIMLGGGDGNGGCGGSGGGAVFYGCATLTYCYTGGEAICCGKIGGHSGGDTGNYCGTNITCLVGAGGGGAGSKGKSNVRYWMGGNNQGSSQPGCGGTGVYSNFAGVGRCYSGGGGGGGCSTLYGYGSCGGGNGGACGACGCPATTYGSGGGGGGYYPYGQVPGGAGCQGIVVVRYPTDGSYGITSSTGGDTCRTCTISGVEYCIHEFTSNGTFCITG